MASSFPFNPTRLRSYILRLPLATRLLLAATVALYLASIPIPWLRDWASLVPSKINLSSLYRLNTYPLMHLSLTHLLLNILALTPLLERFEAENGTLVTLLLFTGPFGLLPGLLYTLLTTLLRTNTPVLGSSIFTFLLLSSESIKASHTHPILRLSLPPSLTPSNPRTLHIPTPLMPLAPLFLTALLIPHTSLLGHACGCAIGYLWGLGWIRFLAPPERVLRWVEGKLNLLGRLPHYVSVDQKTYGRYGVLPTSLDRLERGGVQGTPVGGGVGVRLGP
ncbi:hypothetical protein M501DRAFT_1004202 [Patellaria atrata CBS 101060]|uniref:rhomboid protease n=1 Tax=Patellaria atrata CBS 101060 TaxID=1346257 RepID=A0A9P4S9I0_9PEZI|nr:hypothetical protein M501DRAFT_1004202 [Patellaria atrata CBS 101060]